MDPIDGPWFVPQTVNGVRRSQVREGIPLPDFEDDKYGATEEDLQIVDQTTVRTIDPSFASELMMFWKLKICLNPESRKGPTDRRSIHGP
ncbi:hypothetical protein MTR67_002542 [Solanum verrucosum]|uniref:Uncharacterized protein n=1 Tax=Solanum verrucosum TaxID=315347 RepID=A0AAF0T603_SOLVR|nr:hypothetical protein MTR67_002542 [Solanum verrucosum]